MPAPTLLVEDHDTMREVMAQFLSTMSEIELVGAVPSAEFAIKFFEGTKIELVLIDVSLPGISGIDLVAELRRRQPDLACLMVSGHQETGYIRRSLENGARGYVLKGEPMELLQSVKVVLAGDIYLSEPVREKLAASEKKNSHSVR